MSSQLLAYDNSSQIAFDETRRASAKHSRRPHRIDLHFSVFDTWANIQRGVGRYLFNSKRREPSGRRGRSRRGACSSARRAAPAHSPLPPAPTPTPAPREANSPEGYYN
ncbi:unnamed protein product [Colias eurytheme]|nr:unnamed protein product [Colias eurytheme]